MRLDCPINSTSGTRFQWRAHAYVVGNEKYNEKCCSLNVLNTSICTHSWRHFILVFCALIGAFRYVASRRIALCER